MRSSTIFLVFGAILVALLFFTALNKRGAANHPAVKAAEAFLTAVQKHDIATVNKTLNLDVANMACAGNNITSISFKGGAPFESAFVRQPPVIWSYLDMDGLAVDPAITPEVDSSNTMATVKLTRGFSLFLARDVKSGDWKVFYMSKPEEKK